MPFTPTVSTTKHILRENLGNSSRRESSDGNANGASTLTEQLNSTDYDPIDHLNVIFSHPASLASVPKACDLLSVYRSELDQEINGLSQRHETTTATSLDRMDATKADMLELFNKIEQVRVRALRTEQTITEMTAEIKQLDNAKMNLTVSMTALKRLQMLTTAYEQLKVASQTRQYKECASLVQAVVQLMTHFKSYRSIDQIALLSRNVADTQRELIDQICEDFELIFAKGELFQRKGVLAEACLAMETLGGTAKSRLITWYCNTQLREYRQIFRGNEEAGALDNISRRYAWFKRLLRTYDDQHAPIFPSSWKVNYVLANVFCDYTRDDFKNIFARMSRVGQTIDAILLLTCLQETLGFEHFLSNKLSGVSRLSADTSDTSLFQQKISKAFEPHLGLWIDDQDKQLAAFIPRYRTQPIKPADEEFTPQLVISSSTGLFTFYRHSLTQCSRISTAEPLVDLSKTFSKYLKQYAEQVLSRYANEQSTAVNSAFSAGNVVESPSTLTEDVVMVLNTADYCYVTSNQLEEEIKSRIEERFKSLIDLQGSADAYMGIENNCIKCLVRIVDATLRPGWREMRNLPWNTTTTTTTTTTTAGDSSAYVAVLLENITEGMTAKILSSLHKAQHARSFADHLVESVASAFYSNVVQCKPTSEDAIQQMFLDSDALKTGLNAILDPTPPSFTKRLNNSFKKIETLLKALQVGAPPPPEMTLAATATDPLQVTPTTTHHKDGWWSDVLTKLQMKKK